MTLSDITTCVENLSDKEIKKTRAIKIICGIKADLHGYTDIISFILFFFILFNLNSMRSSV